MEELRKNLPQSPRWEDVLLAFVGVGLVLVLFGPLGGPVQPDNPHIAWRCGIGAKYQPSSLRSAVSCVLLMQKAAHAQDTAER